MNEFEFAITRAVDDLEGSLKEQYQKAIIGQKMDRNKSILLAAAIAAASPAGPAPIIKTFFFILTPQLFINNKLFEVFYKQKDINFIKVFIKFSVNISNIITKNFIFIKCRYANAVFKISLVRRINRF